MTAAKLIIEVVAGVIPGQPVAEYTKRWGVTSSEWHACINDFERLKLLAERGEEADEYAQSIRHPSYVNWVRVDWIWL